ncbi:MAG: peptidoglycan-binding protein [Solirubrobacteraceae bacterium]|nr:peptidoglycan-binding protein [Solirubrobacteraceae bacterium]
MPKLIVPGQRRAAARFTVSAVAIGLSLTWTTPGHAAKPPAPKLTTLRCLDASTVPCAGGVQVVPGDDLRVLGRRIARGQRLTFRWSDGQSSARLVRKKGIGFVVRVPANTATGTVSVTLKDRRGRRSNRLRLKVVDRPPAAPASTVPDPPAVFTESGMWIFDLDAADGGTPAAILARARAARVSTVFLKSADGSTSQGSQFSAEFVRALQAGGVRVCAWQYVYGTAPEAEAAIAIASIRAGADCFVINAEKEYAGRYAEAQRYLAALRAGVGAEYPVGLSSFGLPTSFPNFPFSVFLGPGGAQVDMPQVYWREFEQPVALISARVASGHRIYGRPIAPMGQTYNGATEDDVQSFRSTWAAYGAQGLSWFRWGVTPPEVWEALAQPAPTLDPEDDPGWQAFALGSSGDGVVWLQQHLAAVDPSVEIDGVFGAGTDAALRRFQAKQGFPETGQTGPRTWQALLALTPKRVDWAARARR